MESESRARSPSNKSAISVKLKTHRLSTGCRESEATAVAGDAGAQSDSTKCFDEGFHKSFDDGAIS